MSQAFKAPTNKTKPVSHVKSGFNLSVLETPDRVTVHHTLSSLTATLLKYTNMTKYSIQISILHDKNNMKMILYIISIYKIL